MAGISIITGGTKVKSYKIVTYSNWLKNYKKLYPNARFNVEKTEVVLSCNDGTGTLTEEAASQHITDNWPQQKEE